MDLATTAHRRILVIRLGALGNIVQSLGPFAAIRAYHPDAEITLLTLKPYAAWMKSAPWFDRVWIDEQPAWWDLPGLWRLRKRLIEGQFDRVYDLQTSGRSNRYFKLFPRRNRPEWSGIAPGCSHPDADPNRNRLHDLLRQPNQLRQAGIAHTPPADLSWCTGDIARFNLPDRIVLLVPGCSPRRLGKRWPVEHYAALAAEFVRRGITPVVIGTGSERDLGRAIHAAVPEAVDLTGDTSLGDIADLARAAVGAVGNDTGPMHLIATTGCRCVAIFSHDSDPTLCAPGGADVRVLRRERLATLTPAEVLAAFDA
jgi:ADP-heptose:LPS heptosyltransferase